TTNKLRVAWLEHFIKYTSSRIVGARRLLILDSYKKLCRESNIYTLCMPPYLLHLLQPLNVGCFSPLKRAYRRQIKSLIRSHINHV
ncbi:CENP-B protein, partial [Melanomma pulvis-pyrius CBS 109.77]